VDAATPTPWSTPLWMWAAPFGAALLAYVASSAIFLGLRHPVRTVGAVGVAVALLAVLSINLDMLEHELDRLSQVLTGGRWGLDFALTGGIAALSEEVSVPSGGSKDIWAALPTAGRWAKALLVWFGAALLALALALRRHWER
jgi:hypothetical protein